MMNETISGCSIPTYEQVHELMINPIVLTIVILIYFIPIFIYLLIGFTARGRSSSGQVTSKPMIFFINYFYALITWGVIQLALFILLIFPFWLEFFHC